MSARRRVVAFAWLAFAACGSSSSNGPASGPDADAATQDADGGSTACDAGTALADDGHCEPAGIPPSMCGAGFVSDGNRGCNAVLPTDPCASGSMAVPGESACHDVAPCGSGAWGDIAVEASTQYVDASFAGTSDGSSKAPWKTIHDAVGAAASGAIVAVAAGSYTEIVQIVSKPVRLYGRCPAMVEIVGKTTKGHVAPLEILGGADGAEVHGIAVRSEMDGIYASGSKDVVVDHVWLHDVASRGFDVENVFGASHVSIADSLVENVTGIGVFLYAAEVEMTRSVVRSIQSASDGTYGDGFVVESDTSGNRSALNLSTSVVEGCHDDGVLVTASDATIESTEVRDNQPVVADKHFGRGVDVEGAAGRRASLTLRTSVVERNEDVAIFVAGADATIEATVVRDTRPRTADRRFGRGLDAEALAGGLRGKLVFRTSVVESSHDAGVFVSGADATLESILVRDTKPELASGDFGRGIDAQPNETTGESSTLIARGCFVDSSHDIGIYVDGSEATLDGVFVGNTMPRASDGLFGDGIALFSEPDLANATITGCRIERSARAGVSSFGSSVHLSTSTLECNGIHLDGEADSGRADQFQDLGGNVCGCSGNPAVCQVLSSGLAPPAPLPP